MLEFTLFLLYYSSAAYAGSAGVNVTCDLGNNRLQAGTYQFYSDCNSQTYCEPSNSTCQPKRCRRDDFPFGYPQGSGNVPDKCDRGFFCPDEADKCQPWQKSDQPCQLNRDGKSTPFPCSYLPLTLLSQTNVKVHRTSKS